MGVSAGFQRKIEDWLIGEDWSVAFRPFLTSSNPYKTRIVIAGGSTQPKTEVDDMFVESLLNTTFFEEYYSFTDHSRENKGVLAFASAFEQQHIPVLIANLNTLMVDSSKELTAQKKSADYKRGQEVFREVLTEFQPEVLILHGADAVKQFRQQFVDVLQDDYAAVDKVQELEEIGVFAHVQLPHKQVKVLACRNLSQYGTGTSFSSFLQHILAILG